MRDLRELREPSSAEEIEAFETDVLAGFVLARAPAGLVDSMIRNDVNHLELVRDWSGRPLREMQPAEVRMPGLDDVRWELGRFGKLNVRHGKGSRRKGPKPRLVPLINGAGRNLRWFIEDVRGQFGDDHERHGVPLFPSGRKNRDGSCARAADDVFRRSLAGAASRHLPAWSGRLTPHVLRHFCASQLYLGGMNLFAIQELMGHAWTATTARYIRVHATRVEDAWVTGQRRVADRWKGLAQ